MSPKGWFDLALFILLFVLFIYVFISVRVTNLHKVYFLFHSLMMLWPFSQFAMGMTGNPDLQRLFVTISFVAISLVGGGWFLLTFFLTRTEAQLSKSQTVMILAPAVIAAAGVVLNLGGDFALPVQGGFVQRTYGPWFWVVTAVLLSYFFASLFILFRAMRSPHTSPEVRKQVKITLWGIYVLTGFACLDSFLNVVLGKWLPIIPGLTSLGIFLSCLFFVYVIKKFNVFDLVSIAQEDIINRIPYGILVLDEQGLIMKVNKALSLIRDLRVGDRFELASFLETVKVTGDVGTFLEQYKQKEYRPFRIEIEVESLTERHFILQVSPIVDTYQSFFGSILTFQDVTQERFLVHELNRQNEILQERNQSLDHIRSELSEANRKLEELVLTDSLTDCYNRRYLTQQLTHEVSTNTRYRIPFSLILFDIDHFKNVNDRYGHVVGDEVLLRTAQVVKQAIRSTDILARYGGEEFMIYLPHTEQQLAMQLAERVRLSVELNQVPVELGQALEEVSVTISMGVVAIDVFSEEDPAESPEEYLVRLFSAVDKALYQAKEEGRNRVELGQCANVAPLM